MPGKTFFSSLKQHPLLMKKATCGWLFLCPLVFACGRAYVDAWLD
jgi:hypothetical protein